MKLDKYLLDSDEEIAGLLKKTHRIAVLGIKSEAQRGQPAYDIPLYLQNAGFEVIPVPVYFPDLKEILGKPVYRKLVDIPGDIDMVDVFRRPKDIPAHLDDILAARPKSVWMQFGIRHEEVARKLAEAGIYVVQSRCLMVDHRRLSF